MILVIPSVCSRLQSWQFMRNTKDIETFLQYKEKTIVSRPRKNLFTLYTNESLCKNSADMDRFTSSIMGHNYKITRHVAQTTALISPAARFAQNNTLEKEVTFAKVTIVPPYGQKNQRVRRDRTFQPVSGHTHVSQYT